MKSLKITSVDALDAAVAQACILKIHQTKTMAQMEAEIATIQKKFAPELESGLAEIAEQETSILNYCAANRVALFAEKKSRETPAAVIGFELTPPRVETSSKKTKWSDVVARLLRLDWGRVTCAPENRNRTKTRC